MVKRLRWGLVGILLLAALPALAQVRNSDVLLMNANVRVNVRAGAGTSFPVIGVALPGEIYTVLGRQGGWYQIDYLGRVGYVAAHLVTVSGVAPAQREPELASGVSFTTGYRLNMRTGPGTQYPAFQVLPYGVTVKVIGRTADNIWLRIVYLGRDGWVAARYGSISGNIYYIVPEG